jgi:hypothetical protein
MSRYALVASSSPGRVPSRGLLRCVGATASIHVAMNCYQPNNKGDPVTGVDDQTREILDSRQEMTDLAEPGVSTRS